MGVVGRSALRLLDAPYPHGQRSDAMRLLTFRDPDEGRPTLGVRYGQRVLDIAAAARIAGIAGMPKTMKALLAAGPNALARVRELSGASQAHDGGRFEAAWRDEATLDYLAPIDDADKFLCVGKNYRTAPRRAARQRPHHRDAAGADRVREAQLLPRRP